MLEIKELVIQELQFVNDQGQRLDLPLYQVQLEEMLKNRQLLNTE